MNRVFALIAVAVTAASCTAGAPPPQRELAWRASVTWDVGEDPDAREHAVLVHGPAGDRLILFGGSGYEPQLRPLADAWAFDLESRTWRELAVTGDVPAGGGSRRAAMVGDTCSALLFGGYDERQRPNADLYRMEFSSDSAVAFTRIEQRNPPDARLLHAFVYDPGGDRFVLHAGVGAAGFYDDTWTMTLDDGVAVWTRHDLDPAPSQRYGHVYGYDAASRRMLVFSGADERFPNESPNDTWALDLTGNDLRWDQVHAPEPADSIAGRRNPLWVWDGSQSRLFVWGGTADGRTAVPGLFVLDASDVGFGWTRMTLDGTPDLRASGFGAHDPGRGESWMGFGNFREAYRDLHALGN